MHDKHIIKIDLILVIVSVIGLIVLVGYASPLVIGPIDEYETQDTAILFEIEKADVILIDDNVEFTSPEEYVVKEGLEINLKPGEYYWKAVGVWGSEIRTLTINSEVDLRLRRLENSDAEKYGVFNAGNVKLNIDVYDGDELIDKLKLGVDEEIKVKGNKFVGGQDE
tara:strand:+ start:2518 stop:3018 length:501 start_codon:yes stop_codon:yes gene_type:complete